MDIEGISRSTPLRDFSAAMAVTAVKKTDKTPSAGNRERSAAPPEPAAVSVFRSNGEPSVSKASEANAPEQTHVTGAGQETAKDEDKRYNEVMTEKAMENANNRMRSKQTKVEFGYNDKINRFTITMKNAESGEVVKEIPPEQTQKMLERLHTLSGLMMDTEV